MSGFVSLVSLPVTIMLDIKGFYDFVTRDMSPIYFKIEIYIYSI